MKETLNPLASAQLQVKKACDLLGLDGAVYELLKQPQRVLEVAIPVRMDDGSTRVFTGYRSQHNNAMGPGKGGIRFHPGVTREEVMALSIWMTFKCVVTGIPYGGAKGGVQVDPAELSKAELERLSRGYIDGIHMLIGEKIDVPAPDVNTNGQIMAWMVDEYQKLAGYSTPGALTGKPLEFGGSKGRTKATGLGVAFATREALKKQGRSIQGASVAVQGFGNVGSYTARSCAQLGAKVVAIAEWNHVVYCADGFDVPALHEYFTKNKTMLGFAGAEEISMQQFWALEVDALLPCALENAITQEVARQIGAKLVVEGANGPTTAEADAVLLEKGIPLVPDILANAGGVTVSYFEWVQNLYGYYWGEDEVETKEETAMVNAFHAVAEVADQYNVPMREAAYLYSVKKLAAVMQLRGWC